MLDHRGASPEHRRGRRRWSFPSGVQPAYLLRQLFVFLANPVMRLGTLARLAATGLAALGMAGTEQADGLAAVAASRPKAQSEHAISID